MRVLWWTPLFWPSIGGVEVFAARMLPALRERGHEVMVMTAHSECDAPDDLVVDDVPVHRFRIAEALASRDPTQVVAVRRRISALTRAFDPDLVHLHHPGPVAYFHAHGAGTSPRPTLLTVHSPFEGSSLQPGTIVGRTVRAATWVAGVSRATLGDIIEQVPEVEGRSSVVYNGVAAPALVPTPLAFDPPTILYVGRLAHEKGVDLAITALAKVRHTVPRATLVVAGDGPARAGLEQHARAIGVDGSVMFLGWVHPARVPGLMNTAALVVVPSRYREPFALVALEAALMARPVVAAKTGGLIETVEDGITGVLFGRDDAEGLGEAILRVLRDHGGATQMGQAGRRRALATFAHDTCVDAYDHLYRRLVRPAGAVTSCPHP